MFKYRFCVSFYSYLCLFIYLYSYLFMYLFVIFVHVFISISSFFYLLKGSFLSVVNSVCCYALLVKNDTNDQKPEMQTKVISSCCNCSRRRRHFLWCCCCSCCGHCRLICVFFCV